MEVKTGLLTIIFLLFLLSPQIASARERPDGDVDASCSINIMDLAAVGLCFGCECGQPCWGSCEQADVYPGCDINIFDLATVGVNYGERCRIYGLDFSPYVGGGTPPSPVSESKIRELMDVVAPYTQWIRSYSALNGIERIPYAAKDAGLNVAMGAWIDGVQSTNDQEIANLVSAVEDGMVDIAVVGNEVLQGQLTDEASLIYNINKVKQDLADAGLPGIPVTTPEAYEVLFNRYNNGSLMHQALIDACDVIFVSYYPFWKEVNISDSLAAVHAWHQDVLSVIGSKPVYVAETGWPDDTDTAGTCIRETSAENAATYFLGFVSWAEANDVPYFYFETFDEDYKDEPCQAGDSSQGVGPHWGIWDRNKQLKASMQDVFDGLNATENWVGQPEIELTYVPPIGSFDDLEGRIHHASALSHRVSVYIKVGSGWWTKPTFTNPLTYIWMDGEWACDITTGGIDEQATDIAAFLVPIGYVPPQVSNSPSLPDELFNNSVAHIIVSR